MYQRFHRAVSLTERGLRLICAMWGCPCLHRGELGGEHSSGGSTGHRCPLFGLDRLPALPRPSSGISAPEEHRLLLLALLGVILAASPARAGDSATALEDNRTGEPGVEALAGPRPCGPDLLKVPGKMAV